MYSYLVTTCSFCAGIHTTKHVRLLPCASYEVSNACLYANHSCTKRLPFMVSLLCLEDCVQKFSLALNGFNYHQLASCGQLEQLDMLQFDWPKILVGFSCSPSLVPRPHPLTRRNGLVNQVEFLGLAGALATV